MARRARLRIARWFLAGAMALAFMSPTLSASSPTLQLKKGDRIIMIGNTLAERMQYYCYFETSLYARFPELELVFHNLGYSADELTLRPRQAHFNDHG